MMNREMESAQERKVVKPGKSPPDQAIEKDESLDFLLEEYRQAYLHMRHYDNVQMSLMKYIFSFNLALLSATIAIFHYFSSSPTVPNLLGVILMLGFLAGLISLGFTVSNRAYFVIVTRQVNRIRKFFNDSMELGFDFGEMHMDSTKPRFYNPSSSYSFLIYLICLFNSLLLGGAFYLLLGREVTLPVWFSIIAFIIQLIVSVLILTRKEGKSADEVIPG